MAEETSLKPWQQIGSLLDEGDAAAAGRVISELEGSDAARALCRLDQDDQDRLLATLPTKEAADLLEQLPEFRAGELIQNLTPERAASILEELPSDTQADLIGEIAEAHAEQILRSMDPSDAAEARQLASYPPDTVGGLMAAEYVAFDLETTVGDVVKELRKDADDYEDHEIAYVYVTQGDGRLVGVLRLRDLLLTRSARRIAEIMIREPVTIPVGEELVQAASFFDDHAYLSAPVVDADGRLVGIIQRSAVRRAVGEKAEDELLKARGIIAGEELRSMPIGLRSRRRLAWLSINIVLNVMAASVIALYQETLVQVIALAVFLPIISDMSGCSGNQAVAVSMRELALGLVKPGEVLYVWLKEIGVGVINGIALGVLIALVAWAWKGNPYLGAVVGAALALNTLVAVSIGGTVPLVLRRLGLDPALASGPILTTLTDMCGFFIVLSLATLMLGRLTA